MGWPSTDDDTTIWHTVSRLQDFWKSIREKQKALRYDYFAAESIDPTDDRPNALPDDTTIAHGATPAFGPWYDITNFTITTIDRWIRLAMGSFVANHTKAGGSWAAITNFDGATGFRRWADFSAVDFTYVGDDYWGLWDYVNGTSIDRDGTAVPGDDSTYAWGLTRKYPREIDTLAATQYFQAPTTTGLSFTNGDMTRCLADGKIYLRSAGVWTVQPEGTMPDVLSDVGEFTDGDIVGPWVWNERRKALSALQWTGIWTGDLGLGSVTPSASLSMTTPDVWGSDQAKFINDGGDATDLAGMKSACVANFSNPPDGSFSTDIPFVSGQLQDSGGMPDLYNASLSRWTNWKSTQTGLSDFTTPMTKAVDWYYGKAGPNGDTFDAQGDSVVNDAAYHLWNTVAATTSAVSESGAPFTTNTGVPSWPATPTGGTTMVNGYTITAFACVVRWNFEYQ